MVGGELEFPIASSLEVGAQTERPSQEESQRQRKQNNPRPTKRRKGGKEEVGEHRTHFLCFLLLIPSN